MSVLLSSFPSPCTRAGAYIGANAVSDPLLFLIMAGRSFLKRAPNHAPNHKPPIQFQMLAAWYYISFFLVHGISLIEIGARFKNGLPAIIRNKKRGGGGGGSDTALAPRQYLYL